jgi:hypothetical protein
MSELQASIPNAAVMKSLPDEEFTRIVVNALSDYDLRRPGFNFLAKANLVTPVDDHLYFYPEEHQRFITAALAATREFGATGKVSQHTRDIFILEATEDTLRRMNVPKDTEEFKTFREGVMNMVFSQIKAENQPAAQQQKAFPAVTCQWTQKL